MRVLIDIKHPAHAHFFRNAIELLKSGGHEVLVTARKKEMATELLNTYRIPHTQISAAGKRRIHLVGELFLRNYRFFLLAKRFKPDVILEIMGVTGAPVGRILGIPSLVFQGAENTKITSCISRLCCTRCITPQSFKKNLGKKHFRYPGNQELAYLHPRYFVPKRDVLEKLHLHDNEPFTVIRFVSWSASHDIGHRGISFPMKLRAVEFFSRYGKVFISSEKNLPDELKRYQLTLPYEEIHSLMAFATLLYGESATMASEAAALGTYGVYVDNNGRGYTDELEEKYGIVFNFKESLDDIERSIQKGVQILADKNSKQNALRKKEKLLAESADVTQYVIDQITQVVTHTTLP